MHRNLIFLAIPLFFLFLTAGSLYFGRESLGYFGKTVIISHDAQLQPPSHEPVVTQAHQTPTKDVVATPSETSNPSQITDGEFLSASQINQYIDAILLHPPPPPHQTLLPTLQCPDINTTRYSTLSPSSHNQETNKIIYFFALNLRKSLPILPRLLSSIIQTITFLGPSQCALSIIEGNSNDGTSDVLSSLRVQLDSLGVLYYLQTGVEIDPSKGDRISKLAQLRNLALQPLLDLHHNTTTTTTTTTTTKIVDDKNTNVIFLNDIAPCPEDILELIFQKTNLHASMTCPMDWTYVGPDPTFYDVWVARTIAGDSFFNIPPEDGNWNSAWNLFWNEEGSRARFYTKRPFQVFSCWNGMAVFSAEPLLVLDDDNGATAVKFRGRNIDADECEQGEPQLFCKDLWYRGYGRIAVVPSVNVEYSVEKARMIKLAKGFTGDNVRGLDLDGDVIEWQDEPPEKVKCMPSWGNQFWKPWNESLAEVR